MATLSLRNVSPEIAHSVLLRRLLTHEETGQSWRCARDDRAARRRRLQVDCIGFVWLRHIDRIGRRMIPVFRALPPIQVVPFTGPSQALLDLINYLHSKSHG